MLLNLFNTSSNKIKYLPCTPEVGLIDLFENHAARNDELTKKINAMFPGHRINIRSLTTSADYIKFTKENPRERAKDRLNNIVTKVAGITGNDELHVRRTMYNEYCIFNFSGDNIGELRRLLGPIFNAR